MNSAESQLCDSVGPCSRHRKLQISEINSDQGQISKQMCTIRNAGITILIPLEYFDVINMKSLREIIRPEFSDVMIAYVVGGEARDANLTNYEKQFGQNLLM